MSNFVDWLKEDIADKPVADGKKQKISLDPNSKAYKIGRAAIFYVISLIGLYLIWVAIAWIVNRTVVPTPGATWDALVNFLINGDPSGGRSAWTYIQNSVFTLLKGFFLALLVAYPFALLMGESKYFRELSNPAINILRPIAPVAWAPVLVILLGSGAAGATIVVFIGVFFPVLTSVLFGVTKIDRNWYNAISTLGASRWQAFTKITVPASIPHLVNGMKTGIGIGWMCIVSAELYASTVGGIGNFITNQAGLGSWPNVYAGIIIIGVLGLITVSIVELLARQVDKKWGVEE